MEKLRLLIAEEYDDEDEYIKAVWQGVLDCLRVRDSYGVGISFGDRGYVAYGPFYDKRKATKEGTRYASVLKVPVIVAELKAPSKLDDPTEENKSE
jgi:hypothetical protein